MHDARRDQSQNGLFAIDPKRVAGIMPALKPYDSLGRFGQPVNNLAFAFITPLGADHYNVLAHIAKKANENRDNSP